MRWLGLVGMMLCMVGCGGEPSGSTHPGEQTYNRSCFSCHAAGVAGAPKVGDPEAWAPRIAKGREALLTATVQGVPPGMPPRGLCNSCSDDELAQAIDFMILRSR